MIEGKNKNASRLAIFSDIFIKNSLLLKNYESSLSNLNMQNINFDINLLLEFFIRNKPSSYYVADKKSDNKLINLTNNNADCSITGPSITYLPRTATSLPYVNGTTTTIPTIATTTQITWSSNSLPNVHTFIGISNYNGQTRRRIFTPNGNIIYGHHDGGAGIVLTNNTWNSGTDSKLGANNILKPLVTCIRATNTTPLNGINNINNVIVNNIKDGKNNIPNVNGSNQLLINPIIGRTHTTSDFGFTLVCIFPTFFSDDDMQFISNVFNNVVSYPLLLDYIDSIIDIISFNVVSSQLAGSQLTTSRIAGSQLAGSQLTTSKIAGSQLDASNLAASRIAGSQLAASKLAGSQLAGSKLTAS
jgi:hypothetical protein